MPNVPLDRFLDLVASFMADDVDENVLLTKVAATVKTGVDPSEMILRGALATAFVVRELAECHGGQPGEIVAALREMA